MSRKPKPTFAPPDPPPPAIYTAPPDHRRFMFHETCFRCQAPMVRTYGYLNDLGPMLYRAYVACEHPVTHTSPCFECVVDLQGHLFTEVKRTTVDPAKPKGVSS